MSAAREKLQGGEAEVGIRLGQVFLEVGKGGGGIEFSEMTEGGFASFAVRGAAG